MAYYLVGFPLAWAELLFIAPSNRWRGWLLLDSLGKLVLGFLAVLFLLCTVYAPSYLALRLERDNRVICANLFASLAMMTLVTLAHHLGLMWVAMEATTLLSAPFIYFN